MPMIYDIVVLPKRKRKIESELSNAARKLLARVRDENKWYPSYSDTTPRAMRELIENGYVVTMGRVTVMKSFYVPVGTRSLKREQYPKA